MRTQPSGQNHPNQHAHTARTLAQALPYLQRYHHAVVVIKLGGHAILDAQHIQSFARDITLIHQVGVHPVIVHGGGPGINDMLDKLGIETRFVNGRRVSDATTTMVAEMVLSGSVNQQIVHAILQQGGHSIGLSGKDDALIECDYLHPDLGFVGIPQRINTDLIHHMHKAGLIPVIAPIGIGTDNAGSNATGKTFNINADTAAGAIAAALKADRLLLLTDVDGVRNADGHLLSDLTPDDVPRLIADNVITGGMIPKCETALAALNGGVRAAVILNGQIEHACLLELFTEQGIGSLIRQPKRVR